MGKRPLIVLFELTRACALACRHCRAESVPSRDPAELSTEDVFGVLDDLASLGPPRPMVILTGGDPLERPDIIDIVRHGASSGLRMSVSPAGTPRATLAQLSALRLAGAGGVSFSIDGATPATHDAFRGVAGSLGWTLAGCRASREAGLRLQVNTTVAEETVGELPSILRLVGELGASLWSVFFLVPTGRGERLRALDARQTEEVLEFLRDSASTVALKTTEAPQYRRLVIEHAGGEGTPRRSPLSVGDGRGVVFVSHTGDVQPSGFLPLVVGNVRQVPLTALYATSPLLRALRDPARLRGRCGRCQFRHACGGSRAQAFARSGDPLGEDPTCVFEPAQTPGD